METAKEQKDKRRALDYELLNLYGDFGVDSNNNKNCSSADSIADEECSSGKDMMNDGDDEGDVPLHSFFNSDSDCHDVPNSKRRKVGNEMKNYDELSTKYREQVRREIGQSIFKQFRMSRVNFTAGDMIDVVKFCCINMIGGDQTWDPSFHEKIRKQYNSLSLDERNNLCRLLTHIPNDGGLNEEMLSVLPLFFRKRSEILLRTDRDGGRKERNDKVDLQFIVDYMHDICR